MRGGVLVLCVLIALASGLKRGKWFDHVVIFQVSFFLFFSFEKITIQSSNKLEELHCTILFFLFFFFSRH